ncbi:hypothetical protein [Edaphobacter aggregans]|uniref:hypothetical protein n=1 Tax=Edaphobacter aggregans TaxID=570835 RepID=UPI00068B8128|nr:hypothetical protein [Edaphobacter aggregans]
MTAHWQYQAEFCTPGEGHEKGGVECEGGYFRRNHWVPVPVAADLAALNRKLLEDCRADESRIVSGQTECVGTRLLAEKEHLLPLAAEAFDLAEVSFPRVDQTGCAKVRTNSYSVPLKPGSIVEACVYSTTVEFRHHGTGSPATSVATAVCRRSSIWNTTSTCWIGSPARCADRRRWRSGGPRAAGLRVTTGSGRS